jgi:hypothetical protein
MSGTERSGVELMSVLTGSHVLADQVSFFVRDCADASRQGEGRGGRGSAIGRLSNRQRWVG